MRKRPKITVVNPPKPPTERERALQALKKAGWFVVMTIVILVVGTLINKTTTKATREYLEWVGEP